MIRTYLATYTNGTSTLQYKVGGRSREAARLAAVDLTPDGFTLTGQVVELPEWS